MDIYISRLSIECEPTVHLVVPCCHANGYRWGNSLFLRFEPKSGDLYLAPKRRRKVAGNDRTCSCCGSDHRIFDISNVDSYEIEDWLAGREWVQMVNPSWPARGSETDN